MEKRIKINTHILPYYTKNEEIVNVITHILGGVLGLIVLFLGLGKTVPAGYTAGAIGMTVFGVTMTGLYAISSIYHGLLPGPSKGIMQVIDHCAIYFLIAGTYTPITLCALVPVYPAIGWGLLAFEWGMTALAVTLTAIDMKRFKVFSMICYIGMGWGIIFFLQQAQQVLSADGFGLLLAGGIVYSIGAVIFGIGSKVRWMHSVFHVFVVTGSLLQFLAVYYYVL